MRTWRKIGAISAFSKNHKQHFTTHIMSGKGKGGRGKGKASGKSTTKSVKAGLQFPVGRIGRYLKLGKYATRLGAGAPVYLAAVLECVGRACVSSVRVAQSRSRAWSRLCSPFSSQVPLRGDPRARGQRGARQQEVAHHPAPHPARGAQRRGAQQAARRRHHRVGRCAPEHPRGAPPEEVEVEGVNSLSTRTQTPGVS